MSNKKLATFFLTCYQQEAFIRDAVRSALSQDYSPLEILISDDCSNDRTFEIVQEECEHYHGPHKIILNRNHKNIGAVNHFNSTIPKVQGEFLIPGCGDDISAPNRVSKIMEVWNTYRTPVVTSNAYIMNESGDVLGLAKETNCSYDMSLEHFSRHGINAACYGASMCMSIDLLRKFGPIDTSWSPYNGDHIIPFWGLLSGGNAFIYEPLVYHRIVSLSDSKRNHSIAKSQEERDESILAHHIAQNSYILNTLENYISKFELSRNPQLLTVYGNIQALIKRQTTEWVKVRNRIKLGGKQCSWVDVS